MENNNELIVSSNTNNNNFERNIQQWVVLDNQIQLLNSKLKELRNTKSLITNNITNYIEQNNLNDISIQISDGRIKPIKIKETQPLTFTYLETCLNEIITNQEQVTQIIDYIKRKRQVTISNDIKRVYNNKK
jgi:hypothetical protein